MPIAGSFHTKQPLKVRSPPEVSDAFVDRCWRTFTDILLTSSGGRPRLSGVDDLSGTDRRDRCGAELAAASKVLASKAAGKRSLFHSTTRAINARGDGNVARTAAPVTQGIRTSCSFREGGRTIRQLQRTLSAATFGVRFFEIPDRVCAMPYP